MAEMVNTCDIEMPTPESRRYVGELLTTVVSRVGDVIVMECHMNESGVLMLHREYAVRPEERSEKA